MGDSGLEGENRGALEQIRRLAGSSAAIDAVVRLAGGQHAATWRVDSGLLAALLGTALVTNLIGLVIVAVLGGYFYYAASVEETNLIARFPTAYPAYPATQRC
jgi:hypothetical protein